MDSPNCRFSGYQGTFLFLAVKGLQHEADHLMLLVPRSKPFHLSFSCMCISYIKCMKQMHKGETTFTFSFNMLSAFEKVLNIYEHNYWGCILYVLGYSNKSVVAT